MEIRSTAELASASLAAPASPSQTRSLSAPARFPSSPPYSWLDNASRIALIVWELNLSLLARLPNTPPPPPPPQPLSSPPSPPSLLSNSLHTLGYTLPARITVYILYKIDYRKNKPELAQRLASRPPHRPLNPSPSPPQPLPLLLSPFPL